MKKLTVIIAILFSGIMMQAQERASFKFKETFFEYGNSFKLVDQKEWEYNITIKNEEITIINGDGSGTFQSAKDYDMNVKTFELIPNTKEIYRTAECDTKVEYRAKEVYLDLGYTDKKIQIIICYKNNRISTFGYTYESVMIIDNKVVEGYTIVAYGN